ncbi:insulinase family protein [Thiomicrorhabdus sp. 6S3-12]|uniref:insulinase family protein n=1 Tax=Thiomicrorhabdus sp. 6S3-12 TaxID=2819681 RepID=UPI001AAD060A|nr:insulinase family protein [Thiomicrorhabdus sp. 6S3-12]MBO1924004.1 insulinase family protein [Thiomicrorhabdus sp. 6S3-12]
MSQKLHPAFEYIGATEIETLKLSVEHYRHKITGAEHYHLAADDPQNVFMVALRTLPMDSTGVAHILEHTVLCGSEKYPVRDPFFMMIRRSLNTFMNAFTSSDWTAYPFATENRKDFQNLLQVYLDAVFFPNLDPLDFAQEGHRFEFEEMDNPQSKLTYKGVVFNEMKGAMSSPVSTLWQTLTTELYPSSTYHYNSGGEPEDIPDLTYQQLKDFHQLHYHPSNSVFMTYGDISAYEHQEQFEALALQRFKDAVKQIEVSTEQRYAEPKRVQHSYALDEEETAKKTYINVAWLLGENKDPLEVLKGHLLSAVLLDNSASPMRQVLENTDLAEAPSPLCGFEESNKEMAFVLGVQGSEAEHTEAFEKLILDELQRIAKEGVDQGQLEAMLHQLELSQREVGGDSYPYGLQLILHALSGAMHGGDPIALLDVDAALKELEEEIKNPNFIPGLVQSWLLDNPHRVTLTMVPDKELSAQKEQAEKEKLAQIQARLTDEEKQEIVEQALALHERQGMHDDPSLLPEVTKEDIPVDIKNPQGEKRCLGALPVTDFVCGSNGITYQQMIMQLPELSQHEQAIMPLFSSTLTEIGSAGRGYLETQAYQAAVTGGFGARTALREDLTDSDRFHSHYVLSSKALDRNVSAMSELLAETLYQPNYSEHSRLQDLFAHIRAGIDQGITGSGHMHAMMASMQQFSPIARWKFERSGFAGIRFIKEFYQDLQASPEKIEQLSSDLKGIADKIASASKQALVVSDENGIDNALAAVESFWQDKATAGSRTEFNLSASGKAVKQAWITSTQVNFCAMAYPTVAAGHPDAPKLAVLGACLRNGFLHTAVREKGGAYGGGATYNPEASGFVFYSYRDPRLLETYDDFARAKDWLMSAEATQAKVDEAILNVISAMDKPGSPAGEVKKAFFQELYGRTYEIRMAYRQGVISTTIEELRELADKYFKAERASYAVLTQAASQEMLKDQGFDCFQL